MQVPTGILVTGSRYCRRLLINSGHILFREEFHMPGMFIRNRCRLPSGRVPINCTELASLLQWYYLPTMYSLEFCLGFLGDLPIILGYIFRLKEWKSTDIYLFNPAVLDLLFLCTPTARPRPHPSSASLAAISSMCLLVQNLKRVYIITRPIVFAHSVVNPASYFRGDQFRELLSGRVNTFTYRPLHRPACTSAQVNTFTYRPLHRPECTSVQINTLTCMPFHRPECTSVQINTLTCRPLHRPERTSVQIKTLTYRPLHRPECTSVQVKTLTYRPLHRPECTSVQVNTLTYRPLHRPECTSVQINTLTYRPLHRPECTSVQVKTLTYRPLHRPECTSVQVKTLTYRPLHRPECTSVQVNTFTYRPLHRPECSSEM
ncbi:hypothetical protein JZ751_025817, partial [Albula glossodonta]